MLNPVVWDHTVANTDPVDYTCGWCDRDVTSNRGATASYRNTGQMAGIVRMCTGCGRPSWISTYEPQAPGPKYGEAITHVPDDLASLYGEARDCIGIGAFHAAVMVGRKILMHVAVANGAAAGKKFAFYVDYLVDNNLVLPGSKEWVDEIREVANDANHEIAEIAEEEAKAVVDFVAMLLKLLYEYPARGRQSVAARQARDTSDGSP